MVMAGFMLLAAVPGAASATPLTNAAMSGGDTHFNSRE